MYVHYLIMFRAYFCLIVRKRPIWCTNILSPDPRSFLLRVLQRDETKPVKGTDDLVYEGEKSSHHDWATVPINVNPPSVAYNYEIGQQASASLSEFCTVQALVRLGNLSTLRNIEESINNQWETISTRSLWTMYTHYSTDKCEVGNSWSLEYNRLENFAVKITSRLISTVKI